MLRVCLSDNALVLLNMVALQLVMGKMYVTDHLGELNLAIPAWIGSD